MRELHWLGLAWDEGPDVGGPAGPYRQSERTELYRKACADLVAKGAAYRCDCTAERLDRVRAEQRERKEQPRYDGHCRDRSVPETATHVVRLRVPAGSTTFTDELRGAITIDHGSVDDQVLLKSDGFPTYHLATVVDDHRMGVTHILRAEEWINSVPKHVILYGAFGWPLPKFFHLPLLRNPDKSKISKRKNPTAITWYRENGFLPQALVNFLALMGWSLKEDREEFGLEEMVAAFEPEAIKTTGPIFDLQKLEWLNGVYIRKVPDADLAAALRDVSAAARAADPALLAATLPLVRERMKRLTEYDDLCAFFFARPEPPVDDLVPKKKTRAETVDALTKCRDVLAEAALEPAPLEEAFRDLGARLDLKPRDLFMALRFAVTGKSVSPPIVESMCLLGRDECTARLDAAVNALREGALGPRDA